MTTTEETTSVTYYHLSPKGKTHRGQSQEKCPKCFKEMGLDKGVFTVTGYKTGGKW